MINRQTIGADLPQPSDGGLHLRHLSVWRRRRRFECAGADRSSACRLADWVPPQAAPETWLQRDRRLGVPRSGQIKWIRTKAIISYYLVSCASALWGRSSCGCGFGFGFGFGFGCGTAALAAAAAVAERRFLRAMPQPQPTARSRSRCIWWRPRREL